MKVTVINHRSDDTEMEVSNGIRVFDGNEDEFIINLNNFGELEINGVNDSIYVMPRYSNEIIIKKKLEINTKFSEFVNENHKEPEIAINNGEIVYETNK